MDIKQLKYFWVIAEEGNITGAAKRLYMTQPSLSQQLKLLEDELGVKLIERGNRRLKLTEAGHLLKERAEQVLGILHTTAAELKELHTGQKGTLSIGTIASSGVTLLPSLIKQFHEAYPKVRFQLWEGDTDRILKLLSSGIIEIGIVRSVFDLEEYSAIDLPPEPMIAAVSRAEYFGENFTEIGVGELMGKSLLVHRSNAAMLTECCQEYGFEPEILCSGDDVRSLLVWANEGIGLAIVPKSALGLVPGHNLKYIEISHSPLVIRKAVIWLKKKSLSSPAWHFINAMFPAK